MKISIFFLTLLLSGNLIYGQTPSTNAPSYQETVTYLEEKLNNLAKNIYSSSGTSDKASTEIFTDFKVLKIPDGSIYLKLQQTIDYSGTNNVGKRVYKVTIPICDFKSLSYHSANPAIRTDYDHATLSTIGETIASLTIVNSNFANEVGKTTFYDFLWLNIRMEKPNTLENLEKALLNLKSFCPPPKKDPFDN